MDLATSNVSAAYGRREPRDIVDLLTVHERILLMGAVIWAAVEKALGFTPEGIINEIRRTARLEDYQTHAAARRGQWPSSVEISAAMLERYIAPTSPD